jgi:hypothetical protein
LHIARRTFARVWRRHPVHTLGRKHRIDEALTLAEQAVGVANQVGSVFTEGLAHRVWAQALATATPPRWEEVEAHMTTSLRALESGERAFRPPTRSLSGDDYVAITRTRRQHSTTFGRQPISSPRRNSTTN